VAQRYAACQKKSGITRFARPSALIPFFSGTPLCSASDGRCAPARPALHVSTRLLTFLPRALASTDCFRSFPLFAPPVNVLRWTRRKPSTIRRGAPDVVIGQSSAARAGARPYHFTCDARSRGSASRSRATRDRAATPFQLTDSTRTFSPNILFQPSASSGVAKIRSTISGSGI
jgi:hypothetical protein